MIQAKLRPCAALVGALVAIATVACSSDSGISHSIQELIRERKSENIRLVDATPFKWDQAYLFAPYAPQSHVCGALNIQVKDCARLIPFESNDDGDMSVAFLERGQLVHYARHSRRNGDFTPVPKEQPLSPHSAVFRMVRDNAAGDGRVWLRLVPR